MGLAKYLTLWVDVPHEPGERFKFRMPNWKTVEAARTARRRNMFAMIRETHEAVGAELMAEWKADQQREESENGTTTAIVKRQTTEERLNDFDRALLLETGIADWTYCEPLRDPDGNIVYGENGLPVKDLSKPIPADRESISDLDELTQNWAGLTLMALIDSGFRPVMPKVVMTDDGMVIEVRPGVDPDPKGSTNSFTPSSVGSTA